MIQEVEKRSDQIDRCNSIINKLKNNCLLEHGFYDQSYLKMHDLVRDMALHIIRMGSRRFFIKAGMDVNKMPSKEEFRENVEKVSLMCNRIEFGDYWTPSSPGCLMLTTLLLQYNNIELIPECFFEEMPNLMFLNLSQNPIKTLPDSLSNLKKLTSLIIQDCRNLKKVPCLSKLQGLKQLDLCRTNITGLPMGMEELVNLKYLVLNAVHSFLLQKIPRGILGKLFSLQYLDLDEEITVGREATNLKRLEYIHSRFGDICDLNTFVESRGREFLPYYNIIVAKSLFLRNVYVLSRDARLIVLAGVDIGEELIELPYNVERVVIEAVEGGKRSLNDCVRATSLREATDLRYLKVSWCGEMECVFSAGCPQINNLSTLKLAHLEKLTAIFGFVSCPSTGLLFSLAIIHISGCNRLKELFSFDSLPPNLEEIHVRDCDQMEEIVTCVEGSRITSSSITGSDTAQTQLLCLAKLKILELTNLQQLKSIFPESEIIMASDALTKIEVNNCPLLRRVPLHLPLLPDDQPSAPPYLQQVLIHPLIWWHSSDWGHPNAKVVLLAFLRYNDPEQPWEVKAVEQDILSASAATSSSRQM